MAIIDKPTDYFNTILYNGNSGTQSITGVGFQPNLSWTKVYNTADSHILVDSVRGDKVVRSNTTGAEYDTGVSWTFDTDGFTMTGTTGELNYSGRSYVVWNWKAGTSVSGTTTGAGTGKAYTGSVNTTSGISIIRYQGNGTNGHTIPHHLGVTPTVMMVKRLTGAAANWSNYQSDFWVSGGNQYIDLNRSAAAAADSVMWYNTQPTSSVFTVGTNERTNYNNDYFINYLFTPIQGYSKFGSYTGNGNADGTFVYTGFKPAFVMSKRTDSTENWYMKDNKRDIFNPVDNALYANSNAAELTDWGGATTDYLSNGFKLKTTDSAHNASGGTYIYMAFAENPFVTSTGVPATAR